MTCKLWVLINLRLLGILITSQCITLAIMPTTAQVTAQPRVFPQKSELRTGHSNDFKNCSTGVREASLEDHNTSFIK
jgi:hypothetical protein